jgi:hypothetical protein
MKKNISRILLVLIIFISACAQGKSLNESYYPKLDYQIEKMNTIFIITNPSRNNNSLKNNDILSLDLENLSGDVVNFPGDFNIKVFQKLDSKWVEVQNNFGYPKNDWELLTKADWGAGLGIALNPYISNLEKPTTIRIFVFGKTEKTGETVGAYIDLPLSP